MDGASYYRERADHLRRLAEMTWQRDLEGVVRSLAQDYDETAEDLEAGATGRGLGPDVELMIDAHGSLEVATAIKLANTPPGQLQIA